MKLSTMLTNELPFVIELPNGEYEIKTSTGIVRLTINSDMYSLHTAKFARFAGRGIYVGEDEALQNIIQNEKIENYAFCNCKTFVSCILTDMYEFKSEDYETISEENCKEKIKSNIVRNHIPYISSEDLQRQADESYSQLSADGITSIKESIIIRNRFSNLHQIYSYYEALNNFIKQYAYIRRHFWVHKIDENILEGTLIQDYIDDKFYDSTTFAGLVPSILPSKKKYPEIEPEKLNLLKEKLKNNIQIPVEDELIMVARNLWYRLEYRSAVIESSAALEIVVEKKLIEKMSALGMSQNDMDIELAKTEKNFHQRCDVFLKKYTGFSFVLNNPTLWSIIDQHRKIYRHKIAHSDIVPDRKKSEEIINDFEKAIQYIRQL